MVLRADHDLTPVFTFDAIPGLDNGDVIVGKPAGPMPSEPGSGNASASGSLILTVLQTCC